MTEEKPKHRGLSYSSLTTFLGCNRRYFHKKIAKAPIDSDVEEDLLSFEIGKWFHRVLEVTEHELDGVTQAGVRSIGEEFRLDVDEYLLMIVAMLKSYKSMHKKAGLKATHFETVIETEDFYGIVDVILQDGEGNWWIGDMKTAATHNKMMIPSLTRNAQLSLYALHHKELAKSLGLDPEKFKGCRYRVTTKSKSVKRSNETDAKFVERLLDTVKSYDYIIPKEMLDTDIIRGIHESAVAHMELNSEETFANLPTAVKDSYPQNFNNCLNFFRPCEFWSRCYGKNYTADLGIDCVVSE